MFCLFGVYRLMHSRIVHSYGDATIASEGLQMLTYARHSWLLSWKGSLTCHIYCDKGLPFIMVISKETVTHPLPSVSQWSCNYMFFRLRSVATGDRSSRSCKRGVRSTSTPFRLHLEWLSQKIFKSHLFQMNIWYFITKTCPYLRTEKYEE